jgi:hypothetical protein
MRAMNSGVSLGMHPIVFPPWLYASLMKVFPESDR